VLDPLADDDGDALLDEISRRARRTA
jgi:hypothetical protein